MRQEEKEKKTQTIRIESPLLDLLANTIADNPERLVAISGTQTDLQALLLAVIKALTEPGEGAEGGLQLVANLPIIIENSRAIVKGNVTVANLPGFLGNKISVEGIIVNVPRDGEQSVESIRWEKEPIITFGQAIRIGVAAAKKAGKVAPDTDLDEKAREIKEDPAGVIWRIVTDQLAARGIEVISDKPRIGFTDNRFKLWLRGQKTAVSQSQN
jgi:hypothetical protein